MNHKLIFRAFRAVDDLESCKHFRDGHVSVLQDYGITNITTNNDEWMSNPYIYVVVAEIEDTHEIVGGIRVQISSKDNYLPVETAIGKMDPRIHEIVEMYRDHGGVGELCALWNAKKVAGIGISVLLTRAGISIINQLSFKTLMGICGSYTLKMFRNVGFVEDRSLGENGEFLYPNPDYIAWVLGIMNAETLDTADPYDKARMESLRMQPVQTTIEDGPKHSVEIQYNLLIQKAVHE